MMNNNCGDPKIDDDMTILRSSFRRKIGHEIKTQVIEDNSTKVGIIRGVQ